MNRPPARRAAVRCADTRAQHSQMMVHVAVHAGMRCWPYHVCPCRKRADQLLPEKPRNHWQQFLPVARALSRLHSTAQPTAQRSPLGTKPGGIQASQVKSGECRREKKKR